MCKGEAHGDFERKTNAGGFQMFEFRFCNLKSFRIQGMGFCKNWGMTASVNVMLHPIGWRVSHHLCAKWRGIFETNASCRQAQNQGFFVLPMEQEQSV
jgi:hypothetical protein